MELLDAINVHRVNPPEIDVNEYLRRIDFRGTPSVDLITLESLQRSHLTAVPFENIDVFYQVPVHTHLEHSLNKILTRRRGGWCFENNGAFGALLGALGFDVLRLGAAVLLERPNSVITHLALEVKLDVPYLVDVGFGDSFIRPLQLNSRGPQDGGSGVFEFIDSSHGLTMARHDAKGFPEPQYRFKRVAHELAEFDGASDRFQADRTLHWSEKPFATRLLDGGPDRVTLIGNRLKFIRNGVTESSNIEDADWDDVLRQWFGMQRSD